MRNSILVAAIVACALSAPIASGQDKAAPDQPAMSMEMGQDMMGQDMSQMQHNMTAMQAQMNKIRTTTDPKERRKLMQAHMQAMQDNMMAMNRMGGGQMMNGGGAAGAMGMGDGKSMSGGAKMQRHQMMENRMNMMQMMMEQMLQHLQAMEAMPAK